MDRAHDDDERTVTATAWPPAARSGVRSSSSWGHTLRDGMRLGEFEVTGLIGEGGFGIVYLAYDHSLQRRVALKEYMPSSLAGRTSDGLTVAVKAPHYTQAFGAGLRSFINEARLLAQFDHPSLVKVHRFWEAHGTAYMAMPYYEGPTLKHVLTQMPDPPDEATIRGWLVPLLEALEVLHDQHCFHRDIAPDNILITDNGPLLLDFGAARRVIGDMTHALTVVLKPGYAPVEQYGELPDMAQGPWTDLYALGCVVYCAASGRTPLPSVERLLSDRLVPLSRLARGHYGEGLVRAVDAALAIRPQDRPQSVAAFRELLDAPPVRATVATTPRIARAPALLRRPWPYVVASATAALAAAGWWMVSPESPQPPAAVQAVAVPAPPDVAEADPPAAGIPVTLPVEQAEAPLSTAKPIAKVEATRTRPRAAAAPAPASPTKKQPSPRCSDILQKASLEPLTAEEAAFLRRECQ